MPGFTNNDSIWLKNNRNEFFRKAISIKIQTGAMSMTIAIMIPKGLIYNACKKSPCINESTDLVEPQDGQGIFVMSFIIQISTAFLPC